MPQLSQNPLWSGASRKSFIACPVMLLRDWAVLRIAAKYMMLRPVRLTGKNASQGYALAWLVQPDLTPPRWRAAVRRHGGASAKRGLMAIEDGRGLAHALYSYLIDHDLGLNRLLRVRLYAVSTFPGLDVYGALINSFQALAQQGNCGRIVIDLSECANKGVLSRDFIRKSGFKSRGDNFEKIL